MHNPQSGNPTILDEDACWRGIQARDPDLDGLFVYAVRSTGIYCRPTCPSRRPRREQVVLFASCDEAEAARFRPCRRCNPRGGSPCEEQVDLVHRACRILDTDEGMTLSLDELGQALHVSPSHLHRLFKSLVGLTPHQYAAGRKLCRFKSRVRAGDDIAAAIYEAGYGSSSRLYERAAAQLGMTPATYRQGGKGKMIRYTIVTSYLGRMLVAATEQGICMLAFEDEDTRLQALLHAEYPRAQICRDEAQLEDLVTPLLEHLDGSRPHLALPLDLQATAFQLRVWEELRRIPYGETRTYAQVAKAIGQPKAVRAVARACATNPVSVVTPCHRVVRSDGSLAGYRWGIERKRALLAQERAHACEAESLADQGSLNDASPKNAR